jgi:hypothetical protein
MFNICVYLRSSVDNLSGAVVAAGGLIFPLWSWAHPHYPGKIFFITPLYLHATRAFAAGWQPASMRVHRPPRNWLAADFQADMPHKPALILTALMAL